MNNLQLAKKKLDLCIENLYTLTGAKLESLADIKDFLTFMQGNAEAVEKGLVRCALSGRTFSDIYEVNNFIANL